LRLNVGIDLADIAAITNVLTSGADSNHVTGRGDGAAGSSAQGGVEIAGGVGRKCKDSIRRVAVARGVAEQSAVAAGRVALAFGVTTERFETSSRVYSTGRVTDQRFLTVGGVGDTRGVAIER
jgi:hypothetical protein